MLTLVTADLHLSANPRDAYRLKTMRRLAKRAKRRGVTKTYILGDLTEEKDRHSDYLTNQVVEVVRLFAELGPVTILQGNHDSDSNPDCPFFHFLRHVPQVRWIGKPTIDRSNGFGSILWLPHTRNYKDAWANVSLEDHAIIFAHGMFVGAKLGNGRKAETGIPRTSIPMDARCIAGDVHIPHKVGSIPKGGAAIEYVGAPYTVDFGDDYAPRAIVLDALGKSCPDIELADLPQKRLLEFDRGPDELCAIDELNPGDVLKIRVTLRRRDAPRWPEARDKLRAHYGELGMVVHSIVPVIEEEPGTRVRIGHMIQTKSDGQVLRDFARHRGIDKGTFNRGSELL